MAQQSQPKAKPQTLAITNFSGRLTRILNGDVNSGFAKFQPSWGYDPFSKPMNLTWLETPTDITGPITDLPLAAGITENSGVSNATVFLYDQGKKFYAMQTNSLSSPNVDSVVGIGSIAAGMGTLTRSASMAFFGNTLQAYIGTEYGVNKANFDGSADATIGSANRYWPNTYRPLAKFVGKLMFGNGPTVGAIGSTGSITSTVQSVAGSNVYSELTPPLPNETLTQDLDTTIDGNYLLITGSTTNPERIDTVQQDLQDSTTSNAALFKWNGSDPAVTAFISLPTYSASALQTYLGNNLFFANDAFGMSVNDENRKILLLMNNKAPLPNATCTNGNFLTWVCPEIVGTTRYASLYYFGALDQENPNGLYRVMRWATTQANGNVFQAPLNLLVNNFYKTLNGSGAVTTYGYGKHYIGVGSVNNTSTYQNFLLRFLITPTGSGTPQAGVYETQTQLFSKRIGLAQIRVYTEPTATGNGFQLDIVGTDGSVVTNGTFNYSFVAGSDSTQLQGSFERINFNPNCKTLYGFGVRITNTGTTNMTIKKIEIDYTEEGK